MQFAQFGMQIRVKRLDVERTVFPQQANRQLVHFVMAQALKPL